MEYSKAHFRLRHGQNPEMENYAFEGEVRYVVQLHPDLKSILDAELLSGNHIVEGSGGWPEKESIIVRLEKPFTKKHLIPSTVRFDGECDPHYWHQEYSCASPLHLLVC